MFAVPIIAAVSRPCFMLLTYTNFFHSNNPVSPRQATTEYKLSTIKNKNPLVIFKNKSKCTILNAEASPWPKP